jgi:uncharacterized protein DUF5753
VISRNVNVPPEKVEDRVAARLARQSLFSRDRPAAFTFYLHESVLRLPVGGTVVMAEQLRQLRWMSARSYLTLRVVPIALGAHAAMTGPFRLMQFAEFKPVAAPPPGKPSSPPSPGAQRRELDVTKAKNVGDVEFTDCADASRAGAGEG